MNVGRARPAQPLPLRLVDEAVRETDATPQIDEAALMRRLASGDRRAAEDLVERTYAQIYAALVRLTGDADLAADLTQETYRKAWQALARFDRRSQVGTWLYRIAYNTFLNHVRRPQRLQPLDERRMGAVRDCRPGDEDRLERREVAARLRRAVLGLPEELRFTVTARFWGELRVAEIARLEEVTGAAIRKRLRKAVAYLQTVLGEEAA